MCPAPGSLWRRCRRPTSCPAWSGPATSSPACWLPTMRARSRSARAAHAAVLAPVCRPAPAPATGACALLRCRLLRVHGLTGPLRHTRQVARPWLSSACAAAVGCEPAEAHAELPAAHQARMERRFLTGAHASMPLVARAWVACHTLALPTHCQAARWALQPGLARLQLPPCPALRCLCCHECMPVARNEPGS